MVGARDIGVGGILGMDTVAVMPGMDMGMHTTVTETDITEEGTLPIMETVREVVRGILPKGVSLLVVGVQEVKSSPVNQIDPRRP